MALSSANNHFKCIIISGLQGLCYERVSLPFGSIQWRDFAERYEVAMLVKRHGCGMWRQVMGGT